MADKTLVEIGDKEVIACIVAIRQWSRQCIRAQKVDGMNSATMVAVCLDALTFIVYHDSGRNYDLAAREFPVEIQKVLDERKQHPIPEATMQLTAMFLDSFWDKIIEEEKAKGLQ